MKYLYNTQTKLFLRKCSRVAHTTNVVCLVINVITDLMHPALTLFTLYALCKKRKLACFNFNALILGTGTNCHNLALVFSLTMNQNLTRRHAE